MQAFALHIQSTGCLVRATISLRVIIPNSVADLRRRCERARRPPPFGIRRLLGGLRDNSSAVMRRRSVSTPPYDRRAINGRSR